MSSTMTPAVLDDLWLLKKHYDARLPENVRLVPIPQGVSLEDAQAWLVSNIIDDERLLQRNRFSQDTNIGAVTWRKAFWKRVANCIEEEILISENEDLETHEDILFYLSEIMARPTSFGDGTYIRRFHYQAYESKYSVVTREDEAAISGGTTGLHTWPAALHLANHLLSDTTLVANKRVLEIGSGAGLVAALTSQIQHQSSGIGSLIASDFHEAVLERLQENIGTNRTQPESPERLRVAKLDWFDSKAFPYSSDLDLILASDVIYDPDLTAPLAGCLAYLLQENKGCYAILSQTVRNEETLQTFLNACSTRRLCVREMAPKQAPQGNGLVTGSTDSSRVKLFHITCMDGHGNSPHG